VLGNSSGSFRYFENTGSATSPTFAARTGSANPLVGQDLGFFSAPELGDLDADGDLDLLVGDGFGAFRYFENTGSTTSPAFTSRTGTENPLDGQDVGSRCMPALGDLDADGDLDLFAGASHGVFFFFENTGSAMTPAFVARTGAANPLDGQDVGFDAGPALGDLDGDGDLDLVSGSVINLSEVVHYFENTGSSASVQFVLRTDAGNPFASYDPPDAARSPTLTDLDGDGDLDLVIERDFVENALAQPSPSLLVALPEPGQGWLLGAGLALLSWLARLRGRWQRPEGRSATN
jgi:hypothetical protein